MRHLFEGRADITAGSSLPRNAGAYGSDETGTEIYSSTKGDAVQRRVSCVGMSMHQVESICRDSLRLGGKEIRRTRVLGLRGGST